MLFAAGAVAGEDPTVVHSHRSAGLAHELDGPVGSAFAAALLAALVAVSAGAGRAARWARARRAEATALYDDPAAARALVLAALAAVTAFAAFGRVLSPQYLVWVVPLLALAVAWRMRALAVLTAAACALTLAEFPSRYLDLVAGEPLAVSITGARNAALLAAAVAACAALWRLAATRAPARAGALTPAAGAPARLIAPGRPAPRR